MHLQYKPVVLEALNTAKIPVLTFDPLDPKHLGDPKFADSSDSDREHAALAVHTERCKRTLAHVRPSAAAGVARSFVSLGWLSADEARQAISSPGSSSFNDAVKAFTSDDDVSMCSSSFDRVSTALPNDVDNQ